MSVYTRSALVILRTTASSDSIPVAYDQIPDSVKHPVRGRPSED